MLRSNTVTRSAPPRPIGCTKRPPTLSWSTSGRGTLGKAAETRMASNGAAAGTPSVPSPSTMLTFLMSCAVRRCRAISARSGHRSILVTNEANWASSAVWEPERLDHCGRQRGLGGHLAMWDRYRGIVICQLHLVQRHEDRSRYRAHRVEHPRVVHAGPPSRRDKLLRSWTLHACDVGAARATAAIGMINKARTPLRRVSVA
jgi:hypothetical protein